MQQMASDIFVRILRGMGACRKKPAQPASGSQLDDSIGNTPTTVSWRVWGYEVGLGWRLASSGISLPNNVFSWLLSDFTGPFSRPKNPSKTCAPQGASPVQTLKTCLWSKNHAWVPRRCALNFYLNGCGTRSEKNGTWVEPGGTRWDPAGTRRDPDGTRWTR